MELHLYQNLILEILKEQQMFFTVFLTILILKIKDISRVNSLTAGIIYLIGTFFHELAHYIVALLTTLSFPKGFTLFPKIIKENGIKRVILGQVLVDNKRINIFNAALIGLAPLSLLYLAYINSIYFFAWYGEYFEVGIFAHILYLFLIVTLVVNSMPSTADIRFSLKKGSLFFYILSLLLYCIFL